LGGISFDLRATLKWHQQAQTSSAFTSTPFYEAGDVGMHQYRGPSKVPEKLPTVKVSLPPSLKSWEGILKIETKNRFLEPLQHVCKRYFRGERSIRFRVMDKTYNNMQVAGRHVNGYT